MTPDEVEGYVRRRIGEARELAGYSQREMAARMGMAPSTWQDVERGPRGLDVALIVRIGQVTGRRLSWFLPAELAAGVELGAVIRGFFPGLPEHRVRQIEELARLMWEDWRRSQDNG